MTTDPEVAATHTLETAVEELGARAVCTGQIAPKLPVALTLPDGTVATFAGSDAEATPASIAAVLRCAKPAVFGDGEETRLDLSVRNGLQIGVADGLTVDNLELGPVLEKIRAALCPRVGALVAELHSVNVYQAKGHFVRHKDTPDREDFVGTLVVVLPTWFTGGVLKLKVGEEVTRFDWAEKVSAKSSAALRWAAFFGDVDHAVAKVEGGCRITVTYRLRRKGDAVAHELDERGRAVRDAFAAFPPGDTTTSLMIPCEHLYPANKQTPLSFTVSAATLDRLRGRDAEIAAAAQAAGRSVRAVRCLASGEWEDVWALERPLTRKVIAGLPDELTPEALDGVTSDIDGRLVLVRALGGRTHVFTSDYSPTGYFGNEHAETEFYVITALIVEVPARAPLEVEAPNMVHAKFGRGVVLAKIGSGDKVSYKIRFSDGERTILAKFLTPG